MCRTRGPWLLNARVKLTSWVELIDHISSDGDIPFILPSRSQFLFVTSAWVRFRSSSQLTSLLTQLAWISWIDCVWQRVKNWWEGLRSWWSSPSDLSGNLLLCLSPMCRGATGRLLSPCVITLDSVRFNTFPFPSCSVYRSNFHSNFKQHNFKQHNRNQ